MTAASIADVGTRLHRGGTPVLFVDTCTFLDIVRLTREAKTIPRMKREFAAFRCVCNAAASQPRKLALVLPPSVLDEFANNKQAVLETVLEKAKACHECAERFRATQESLGIDRSARIAEWKLMYTARRTLKDVEAVMAQATELSRDDDAMAAAMSRVVAGIAPSQKGDQGRDCVIVEHALRVVSDLRAKGGNQPSVFLSSNKNDYCDRPTSRLRSPLDNDFQSVDLEFAMNWELARHKLGLRIV